MDYCNGNRGTYKLMAIQLITNKKITKFDVTDPNFKPLPKPEPEVVNGNLKEETDIYGEKVHTYQPDNGNLQMSEFMTGVLNKLDGLQNLNPDIVQIIELLRWISKERLLLVKLISMGLLRKKLKVKL